MAGEETSPLNESETTTPSTSVPPQTDVSIETNPQLIEENNTNDNTEPSSSSQFSPSDDVRTSDVLAKGVSSLLATVMRDFDSKAQNALKSQDQLGSAIDRLTGELDQLLEDAPLPFIMQHAAKISGVRKRVLSLNSLLKSIQRRIDNIDRMLSTGLSHGKPIAELDRPNQL